MVIFVEIAKYIKNNDNNLRSSFDLSNQEVNNNISKNLEQFVGFLGIGVEPSFRLGHCFGTASFDHVAHQSPLYNQYNCYLQ